MIFAAITAPQDVFFTDKNRKGAGTTDSERLVDEYDGIFVERMDTHFCEGVVSESQ